MKMYRIVMKINDQFLKKKSNLSELHCPKIKLLFQSTNVLRVTTLEDLARKRILTILSSVSKVCYTAKTVHHF